MYILCLYIFFKKTPISHVYLTYVHIYIFAVYIYMTYVLLLLLSCMNYYYAVVMF